MAVTAAAANNFFIYCFLFGSNATVNVGGMVAFTTADHLRLAEIDGTAGIFRADTQLTTILTSAPIVAFGFLGSNPAAIAIQGSTLTVQPGQSISLVGGNQGFNYTNPDTGASAFVPGGVTITGGKLMALGGQISLVSVASPGEVLNHNFEYGPNINGAQFATLGKISLTDGALLDVSADSAGAVKIRGGQLVIANATVSANTGSVDGSPVAIDIKVSDGVSLSSAHLSALTATTSSTGNAGDIKISSDSLNATFGTDSFFVSLIDSHSIGHGNGGNVFIDTGIGPLTVNATPTAEGRNFITNGTGGEGNGGNVTITAGDVELTNTTIDTGLNVFNGSGSGGNLSIKATSLVVDNVLLGTDSIGNKAGALNLDSSGL